MFESRYLFARSVVQDTPCLYALKRITAVIHEADDGPSGKIGDFGVHLLDAYAADLEVVLVVERGVEVEHPAGIGPEGIVSGRQGIGEGYSVGKAEGVAFDLLREDKTSPLVDQIDIDKVGQGIPSVVHGIEKVPFEPDRISGGIVGLVQVQPQLLLLLAPDPLKIQRNAVHTGLCSCRLSVARKDTQFQNGQKK